MVLHSLFVVALLGPLFFLLHSAILIYKRNPYSIENRFGTLTMTFLFLTFLADFMQQMMPEPYVMGIVAYFKYPAAWLTAGTSVLFHVALTSPYRLLRWPYATIAAFLPVTVYTGLLAVYGPSFFFDRLTPSVFGPLEVPKETFGLILLFIGFVAILNQYLAIRANLQARSKHEKHRFALLIRSNIVYAIAAVVGSAILVAFIDRVVFPSTWHIIPTLVWGIVIRWMMRRNDLLPAAARKYQLLFNRSPSPILFLDEEGHIRDANPSAHAMLGVPSGKMKGVSFADFLPDEEREAELFDYCGGFPDLVWEEREMTVCTATGERRTVLVDLDTMIDLGQPVAVAVIRDITQRKEVERRNAYLAYHDALTGLPNRLSCMKELDAVLSNGSSVGSFASVLLIDLDRFKMINDTLGHLLGDEAIRQVAHRLLACLPSHDMLARVGGDEFLVLTRHPAEYDDFIQLAERLLETLQMPLSLRKREFFLSASIGIVVIPEGETSGDTLLRKADIAMYDAKSNGGNKYRLFSNELLVSVERRVDMEEALRKGLDRGNFSLRFQPQIRIEDGKLIGAEALLRWNSPEFGHVSPAEFIPLAERTGLILPIGRWVLEQSCLEAKRWEANGADDLVVSANVSAKQFTQPDFVDQVRAILQQTALLPHKLCIEITESVLIEKLDVTLNMLGELTAMGVRISIDDFGTGYSSLSLLRQLPITAIKIDRSFIIEMRSVDPRQTIVPALISMAHTLGKTIVAEGIETIEQLKWLKTMGCNEAQGYFIDPPLSAQEFLRRLLREDAM